MVDKELARQFELVKPIHTAGVRKEDVNLGKTGGGRDTHEAPWSGGVNSPLEHSSDTRTEADRCAVGGQMKGLGRFLKCTHHRLKKTPVFLKRRRRTRGAAVWSTGRGSVSRSNRDRCDARTVTFVTV